MIGRNFKEDVLKVQEMLQREGSINVNILNTMAPTEFDLNISLLKCLRIYVKTC